MFVLYFYPYYGFGRTSYGGGEHFADCSHAIPAEIDLKSGMGLLGLSRTTPRYRLDKQQE